MFFFNANFPDMLPLMKQINNTLYSYSQANIT